MILPPLPPGTTLRAEADGTTLRIAWTGGKASLYWLRLAAVWVAIPSILLIPWFQFRHGNRLGLMASLLTLPCLAALLGRRLLHLVRATGHPELSLDPERLSYDPGRGQPQVLWARNLVRTLRLGQDGMSVHLTAAEPPLERSWLPKDAPAITLSLAIPSPEDAAWLEILIRQWWTRDPA